MLQVRDVGCKCSDLIGLLVSRARSTGTSQVDLCVVTLGWAAIKH